MSTLPPWPSIAPAHGAVVLRQFTDADAPLVLELSTDPYVPLISSVPPDATRQQAHEWIERNRERWSAGSGFSFAIAEAATGRAVGQAGLWLAELDRGRASAGYLVSPGARGRGLAGDALTALTEFAWTLPSLHRVQLFIEPLNTASVRTAERAGYEHEGLLRGYMEIGGRRRDMLLFAVIRPA